MGEANIISEENKKQGTYCKIGDACTGFQGGTFSTSIDLESEIIKEYANPLKLYSPVHFNPKGYAFAANKIAEHIK